MRHHRKRPSTYKFWCILYATFTCNIASALYPSLDKSTHQSHPTVYNLLYISQLESSKSKATFKESVISESKSEKSSRNSAVRTVLLRTGSVVLLPGTPVVPGLPRVSLSRHDSASCLSSAESSSVNSPRISLHFDSNRRRDSPARMGIRRAYSETDVIRCESQFSRLNGAGSWSFQSTLPEEEYLSERDDAYRVGSLPKGAGIWPESGIPVEELGFSGGGFDRGGKKSCGGDDDNGVGNREERSKIGAYYLEMLKSNPEDSLSLRNYGKYLHEVENDTGRAEEYYGRAILASPGDGELLSLYGNLIWETQKDGDRARSTSIRPFMPPLMTAWCWDRMRTLCGKQRRKKEKENEESKKIDGASPQVLVAAF